MRLARVFLMGGALLAAAPPAAAEEPVAVQTAEVYPGPPVAVPAPPAPARRHPALRNTGITFFALGAGQIVAGGVLLGLASSNSNCGGDCRTGNEVARGIAVPLMIFAGVFALAPGAIMWGVGSRL